MTLIQHQNPTCGPMALGRMSTLTRWGFCVLHLTFSGDQKIIVMQCKSINYKIIRWIWMDVFIVKSWIK